MVKVICYALQIKLTGRLRLFPMKTDFAAGIGKKISGVTVCIKVGVWSSLWSTSRQNSGRKILCKKLK